MERSLYVEGVRRDVNGDHHPQVSGPPSWEGITLIQGPGSKAPESAQVIGPLKDFGGANVQEYRTRPTLKRTSE